MLTTNINRLTLTSCFNSDSGPPPRTLVEVLQCVEEFRYHLPNASAAASAFRVIGEMVESFPLSLGPLFYKYVQSLLSDKPHFVFNTIALIDRLTQSSKPDARALAHSYLSSFE